MILISVRQITLNYVLCQNQKGIMVEDVKNHLSLTKATPWDILESFLSQRIYGDYAGYT
jgi:hypothetical protein